MRHPKQGELIIQGRPAALAEIFSGKDGLKIFFFFKEGENPPPPQPAGPPLLLGKLSGCSPAFQAFFQLELWEGTPKASEAAMAIK